MRHEANCYANGRMVDIEDPIEWIRTFEPGDLEVRLMLVFGTQCRKDHASYYSPYWANVFDSATQIMLYVSFDNWEEAKRWCTVNLVDRGHKVLLEERRYLKGSKS